MVLLKRLRNETIAKFVFSKEKPKIAAIAIKLQGNSFLFCPANPGF